MNKKIILVIISVVAIFFIVIPLVPISDSNNTKVERLNNGTFLKIYDAPKTIQILNNTVYITPKGIDEGNQTIVIPVSKLLFRHTFHLNSDNSINYSEISPEPKYTELYHKIGLYNSSKKIVFVYPIFTQTAYEKNGFYDYYSGNCDSSCLTAKIMYDEHGRYTSSIRAAAILTLLNYSYITDVDIDKNPDILKRYDRVIMLHNEYVTKREFNAVTQHPDVIYLFANALYAEVKADYNSNTITLVRGHGYSDASTKNGFDWKFDNTPDEYDNLCNNWNFTKIDNGKMLDCYPSFRLFYDEKLLESLKN